jgi:hypothetical protein
VILVLEIEKYPLLYNYILPEYSRKDLTDKAWTGIAKKTRFMGIIYNKYFLKLNTMTILPGKRCSW